MYTSFGYKGKAHRKGLNTKIFETTFTKKKKRKGHRVRIL